MNNIYVYTATINDIELLAKLEKEIWQKTYEDILPQTYITGLNISHIKHKFFKRLFDNKIETYIVYKETIPVGYFVLTKVARQQLEVSKIYLLPEYQQQGIGQYCYRLIIDMATERNIKVIEVWIVKGNQPSITFHQKMNFNFTGISRPLKGFDDCFVFKYVKILSSIDNLTI